ncbi:hypothetical protein F5884DRAFT_694326 [Xylogone sp. PMI_703]|nr:hypothetical protein F5884DRAFT_694326 [Xylogone sp. PMI_703]
MSICQTVTELWPPKPRFTEADIPDLSGKTYLVTGGTSGIGLAVCKVLYSKNAKVYLTSRTPASADKAIKDIKQSQPSSRGELRFIAMDLTDLSTIAPAMREFLAQESTLHSVWLNAGVMDVPKGSRTKQDYELTWGTNVVAHYVIQQILLPILLSTVKVAPPGSVRVVWVSSGGHNTYSPKGDGIDWKDITEKKPKGWKGEKDSMTYYGQSKAGNVLLAKELAKRYGKDGLVGVSLNPGNLKTNLFRDEKAAWVKLIEILFLHDVRFGALTELYAGLSPDVGLENNGAYVIPWGRLGHIRKDIEAGFQNRDSGTRLWNILEGETKAYL